VPSIMTQMAWPFMAESLLKDIRQQGYSVGSVKVFNRESGEYAYMVDATDAKTGENWTVQAETEYDAVVELAMQLGWDFEE